MVGKVDGDVENEQSRNDSELRAMRVKNAPCSMGDEQFVIDDVMKQNEVDGKDSLLMVVINGSDCVTTPPITTFSKIISSTSSEKVRLMGEEEKVRAVSVRPEISTEPEWWMRIVYGRMGAVGVDAREESSERETSVSEKSPPDVSKREVWMMESGTMRSISDTTQPPSDVISPRSVWMVFHPSTQTITVVLFLADHDFTATPVPFIHSFITPPPPITTICCALPTNRVKANGIE